MTRVKMRLGFWLLFLLLVVGCAGSECQGINWSGNIVQYYHDEPHKVSCWFSNGIYCLPDKDVEGLRP